MHFVDLMIVIVREGERKAEVSTSTNVNDRQILLLFGGNTLWVSSGSQRAKSWYNAHSTH